MKDKFLKYLNNKETDECINRIKDEIKLLMYNKKQNIEWHLVLLLYDVVFRLSNYNRFALE